MNNAKHRVCHICGGKKEVEGQPCRPCEATGYLPAHNWSNRRLELFRSLAFKLMLEELTERPPKYDYSSEIGRWLNAIMFEFADLLKTGKVTGKRFYLTEEQTREYIASLGPSPLKMAMQKMFAINGHG